MPIQLGKHFWPQWALVQGVRVDYLAPTIYLTDLLTIPFVIIFLKALLGRNYKISGLTIGLMVMLLINATIAKESFVVMLVGVKLIQVAAIVYFIKITKLKLLNDFTKPLLISAVFVAIIGIVQFINKATLGGILYFLGERDFTIATPGIALVNFGGVDYLRAYSFFSHPNSLAGYLGVVLILGFGLLKYKKLIPVLALLVISVGIFLTFSKSVISALLIVLLLSRFGDLRKFGKPVLTLTILGSLLVFFTSNMIWYSGLEFVDKRLLLNEIGLKVFLSNPLFGVGLKNFLILTPLFMRSVGYWFVQPIHNVFILVLVELGVVGFLLMLVYLTKVLNIIKNNKLFMLVLIFILLTALTDHYWITLQQNILLLAVILGFFENNISRHKVAKD